jgi:hypothetical protein
VEQLAPGGRLVVPLRMRGLTRSLALDRDGDHLVSRSAMICGFVRMQGAGAHLAADPEQDPVLVAAGNRWFNPAVVGGDSFAYLTTRPAGQGRVEFGAHAFGPQGPAAAQAMVEQVRVWDRDRRAGVGPTLAVWPKDTPDEALPQGLIINKRYNRVTISWPAATIIPGQKGTFPHLSARVAPLFAVSGQRVTGPIGSGKVPDYFPVSPPHRLHRNVRQ